MSNSEQMSLGIYIEKNHLFLTESRKNKNDIEIINKDNFEIDNNNEIDNIVDEIKSRVDCKRCKNLDITLPSEDFIIDYYELDGMKSNIEIKEKIEEKLPSREYIAKKIHTHGLEKDILITVSLEREVINEYFNISNKLKLRPRTLTPYFSKLASEQLYNYIERDITDLRAAIIYFYKSSIDIMFMDSLKLSFFKRIERKENINSLLDVIKFYISNSSSREKLHIYYYGHVDEEYIDAIRRLEFDIVLKSFQIPDSIGCAKSFNSAISAY